LPAGRTVSAKEQSGIRTALRESLKSISRENLLAIWYGFMWVARDEYKNFEEMKKAKFAIASLPDQAIVKRILDRDVKEIVESLQKGF
jgi:hypothetical protein